jgi:hypothetical protein
MLGQEVAMELELTLELMPGTMYTEYAQIARFTGRANPSERTVYIWEQFEHNLFSALDGDASEKEEFLCRGGSVAVFLLLTRDIDSDEYEEERALLDGFLGWKGQSDLLRNNNMAYWVRFGGGKLQQALNYDEVEHV